MALSSLNVPALGQSEVDRMVVAAMPPAPPGWSGWLSHAAAVFLGVSLMAVGRGCQNSADLVAAPDPMETANASTAAPPPQGEPVTREVIVEVPVEEIVERVVEVRVEVPVEKVVERIVYRDRPVMNALQPRFDAQLRLARTLSDAALTGVHMVERAYTRIEQRSAAPQAPELQAPSRVMASATPGSKAAQPAKPRRGPQRTHLEVRRVGGQVTLRTRGSLLEVVPVLIDTLESEDGEVVAAALDRLQFIHADLGPRAVNLREEATSPRRHSGLRALLSGKGSAIRASELDDAALWRNWWSRQRASDGTQRRAASI